MSWIFLIILLALLIVFSIMSIKIVRQSEVYIIERLGKFHKVADAGLTIIVPFIDHVRSIVSLKQQTLDIPPQQVITKDNVTITINTVVFYRVVDPAKAVYEIQNLKKGLEYLSVTTMRDLVGKMDLDATFSSRDNINDKLRAILDEATDGWGCTVDRVEVEDIILPPDIKDAMERQMNAERTKRAAILQAEGERQAAVLKAQGEKDAAILHAEAERETRMRTAAGEADAIRRVAEAKADEVKMVYGAMMRANPDEKLVQLKSLETLRDVANGESNKVFIPFDATSSLASLGAMREMLDDNSKNKKKNK
ncbi:MAG: SPFH/Band 7/PHB domain protein [Clostridia bacterium]|nr:SPFH/Band 7/PHB domain protein [Clostridia bacterium]